MPESRLRIGEAAAILGISEDHLRDLTNDNKIPCERTPGGHRLFDPQLLDHIKEYGLDKWMGDYEKTVAALTKSKKYDPTKGNQVDTTITAGFFVCDTGAEMVAGFGHVPFRPMRIDPLYFKQSVNLFTDATTYGTVEAITLVVDPLVLPAGCTPQQAEETKTSYAAMLSALLAGEVTIDSVPYPQIFAMSKVRVIQAAYSGDPQMVAPGLDFGPKDGQLDPKVEMLPSSLFGVHLRVPSRTVLEQPQWDREGKRPAPNIYTYEHQGRSHPSHHVLTGMIMVEQRNVSMLVGLG